MSLCLCKIMYCLNIVFIALNMLLFPLQDVLTVCRCKMLVKRSAPSLALIFVTILLLPVPYYYYVVNLPASSRGFPYVRI